MLAKFSLSQNTIDLLYKKYRPFFLPVVVIISCVLLVVFFGVSQIQQFFIQKQEQELLEKRVSIIQKNQNLLSQISPETNKNWFTVSLLALPSRKDYIGVLYSIAYASAISNVSVNDFTFQVGELDTTIEKVQDADLPSINLQVSVQTGAQGVVRFIEALFQTTPISEAKLVSIGENSSTLDLSFYYKPLSDAPIRYDSAVQSMTPKDLALIQTLSGWEKNTNSETFFQELTLPSETGTKSAEFDSGTLSSGSATILP